MEWSEEKKLAFYEKAADDETVAREQRMLFARKANSLRIISRLQATGQIASGLREGERARLADDESLLFSPTRMAAYLRERADEACRAFLNKNKQPVELMASLKESVEQKASHRAKKKRA